MRRLPPATAELAWKLDNLHTWLNVDGLGGMAELEGNPWGMQIKRFGRAVAIVCAGIDSTDYNKVLGLGIAELPLLDAVAEFVVSSNAPTCRVDVLPGDFNQQLADRLASHELRHVGFSAGYYGWPDVGDQVAPPGVAVRRVETDSDMNACLDIFHRGTGMDESTRGAFIQTMRYWRRLPGWNLYLTEVEGAPRGMGVMTTREDVAYLGLSATLPEWRDHHCEQAFVHHALLHAGELGCELVHGQCDYASPTARCFEEFAMQMLFTKALWVSSPDLGADQLYWSQGQPLY